MNNTLYDLLYSLQDSPYELARVLLKLDSFLEYVHEHGMCIYNFDTRKVMLYNGELNINSFQGLLDDINNYDNAKVLNIFQNCKIGLTSYNKNFDIDSSINQEQYNFLRRNVNNFNFDRNIPDELMEYYQEILVNGNIMYLNDYINKKMKEEESNRSNTNVMRKTLSTEIGRAFAEETQEEDSSFISYLNNIDKNNKQSAFTNVLLLPGIVAITYIISMIFFMLFL